MLNKRRIIRHCKYLVNGLLYFPANVLYVLVRIVTETNRTLLIWGASPWSE